ncbi:MAG: RsmD family RNA methyltransferase [Candidatus Woesearchaeota archaeon]
MTVPKCKYYKKCGGCDCQHLDYARQLQIKKKALIHCSWFENVDLVSGDPYGYRNRMDLIFLGNVIGFRMKVKPGRVIDIDRCEIANERLNKLITEVRSHFKGVDAFNPHLANGTYMFAVVRTPSNDSSISFVLNNESDGIDDALVRIKEFAKVTSANNVLVTYCIPDSPMSISSDYIVVKGKEMLTETLIGKKFHFSAQGFFQNNTQIAEMMQEHVHKLLSKYDTHNAHLLDLYAGVGTFGIINSSLFKSVSIVESFKSCIDAADLNIIENKVKNAKTYAVDAKKINKIDLHAPLFVIVDPPRSGMEYKVIEYLCQLKPKVIIYISCNADEFKKEAKHFKEFEVKTVTLFDMFPQTVHSEAVIEMVRKE